LSGLFGGFWQITAQIAKKSDDKSRFDATKSECEATKSVFNATKSELK
jgi:hypothetical protein